MQRNRSVVLVVEDDESWMQRLTGYVVAHGFDVVQASTFRSAVGRISVRYALVIADLNLSGQPTGGIELLERVNGAFADTALVLITAHGNQTVRARTAAIGAHYISKQDVTRDRFLELLKVIGVIDSEGAVTTEPGDDSSRTEPVKMLWGTPGFLAKGALGIA